MQNKDGLPGHTGDPASQMTENNEVEENKETPRKNWVKGDSSDGEVDLWTVTAVIERLDT